MIIYVPDSYKIKEKKKNIINQLHFVYHRVWFWLYKSLKQFSLMSSNKNGNPLIVKGYGSFITTKKTLNFPI